MHRFRRSPARRKRQFHMAGRHCASARLLERHEVVVYHWQMSHVGEPANEWADREAAARADAEEPRELVEAEYSFTTALLPRDACSTRSWAVRRADLWVACRLRAHSHNAIYAEPRDVRPLHAEPREATVIPAVRNERCFISDAGLHLDAETARRRRWLLCPFCEAAPCTWAHFALECEHCEMVTAQQAWAEKVKDVQLLA